MGLSKKITGYDRFMDKFNRKKRQTGNVQVKSRFGDKPITKAPKTGK